MKWQLVGNIPYNLSGYILRRLTQLDHPPTQALFMVQKEVALRLLAQPPEMNLLGLSAQLWGTTHLLLQVPRSCFWPSPEVDSAAVLLIPHAEGTREEREAVLKVAKVFFQHKRKQMGGVLKRDWHVPAAAAEEILANVGIAATARPQELSVAQWQNLAKQLTPLR